MVKLNSIWLVFTSLLFCVENNVAFASCSSALNAPATSSNQCAIAWKVRHAMSFRISISGKYKYSVLELIQQGTRVKGAIGMYREVDTELQIRVMSVNNCYTAQVDARVADMIWKPPSIPPAGNSCGGQLRAPDPALPTSHGVQLFKILRAFSASTEVYNDHIQLRQDSRGNFVIMATPKADPSARHIFHLGSNSPIKISLWEEVDIKLTKLDKVPSDVLGWGKAGISIKTGNRFQLLNLDGDIACSIKEPDFASNLSEDFLKMFKSISGINIDFNDPSNINISANKSKVVSYSALSPESWKKKQLPISPIMLICQ